MFDKDFIQFLTSEKRFSTHTISSYKTDLDQFIVYLSVNLEIKELKDIDFQHIRSWIASLLEVGLSPRSVNRKISTLKTYFKFLLRNDLISESPMSKIISPKVKKRLPIFIEQDEMAELLNNIDFESGFIGERDKLIIELFYVTGIRLSELINIKLEDINFQNKLIKILGKRNKERLIPLSESLIIEIQAFVNRYNIKRFVFTNLDGDQVYPKLVYRIVKKYIGKISTINKRSPHVLRHTFATHMLNNGADINAIKELLGHANLSATQVYTHNTIDKLKTIYKQAHPRA